VRQHRLMLGHLVIRVDDQCSIQRVLRQLRIVGRTFDDLHVPQALLFDARAQRSERLLADVDRVNAARVADGLRKSDGEEALARPHVSDNRSRGDAHDLEDVCDALLVLPCGLLGYPVLRLTSQRLDTAVRECHGQRSGQ